MDERRAELERIDRRLDRLLRGKHPSELPGISQYLCRQLKARRAELLAELELAG